MIEAIVAGLLLSLLSVMSMSFCYVACMSKRLPYKTIDGLNTIGMYSMVMSLIVALILAVIILIKGLFL